MSSGRASQIRCGEFLAFIPDFYVCSRTVHLNVHVSEEFALYICRGHGATARSFATKLGETNFRLIHPPETGGWENVRNFQGDESDFAVREAKFQTKKGRFSQLDRRRRRFRVGTRCRRTPLVATRQSVRTNTHTIERRRLKGHWRGRRDKVGRMTSN